MADSNPLSLLVAIKFIDLLSTPFAEWEAFKLGLIDSKGRKVRDPVGQKEKKYFRSWYNLVRNIKRSLMLVPGGSTRFSSYAAAFALLREAIFEETGDLPDEKLIREAIDRDNINKGIRKTGKVLLPGTYIVVEGVMKDVLKLQGHGLMFKTESPIHPIDTPFGEIYLINEKERRIAVCEQSIVRL